MKLTQEEIEAISELDQTHRWRGCYIDADYEEDAMLIDGVLTHSQIIALADLIRGKQ